MNLTLKVIPQQRSDIIAKNQNTFAKKQREMEKKRKAEEKRAKRKERKANEAAAALLAANPPVVEEGADGDEEADSAGNA